MNHKIQRKEFFYEFLMLLLVMRVSAEDRKAKKQKNNSNNNNKTWVNHNIRMSCSCISTFVLSFTLVSTNRLSRPCF